MLSGVVVTTYSDVQFDTLDTHDTIPCMARVRFAPESDIQLELLPRDIQHRMHGIFDRLEKWPEVSGAKPLRHELKGLYRIPTGDFRVLFRVVGGDVWIVRIHHRKDVYED